MFSMFLYLYGPKNIKIKQIRFNFLEKKEKNRERGKLNYEGQILYVY